MTDCGRRHPRRGPRQLLRPAGSRRRRPDPAVRPRRQRHSAGLRHAGAAAEQLRATSPTTSAPRGVTRALAAALGAPAVMTRYSRLLIDPNRGRRRPDADHAPVGRRRRFPATASSTRPSARSACASTTTLSPRHRRRHRPVPRQRRRARPAVDPFLHRKLEGAPAALARRRAVGQGPAARQAPARGPLRRGRPHRRRQRALFRPARRRLHVAARHLPRACQRHHRDPAGPDPRRRPARLAGRGGSAALSKRFRALHRAQSSPVVGAENAGRAGVPRQRDEGNEWSRGHDQDRQSAGDGAGGGGLPQAGGALARRAPTCRTST